ncbi:zinc carboxypeptidase [bacterium BMS3Abin03]|nr:zinc carboxypeptidase [bacterium BMS3Abin03]
MKTILTFIILLAAVPNLTAQTGEDWITYFERSGFIATPDYTESMSYFQRLDDFSQYAELKTFGYSPQGRGLKYLVVSKDKAFSPAEVKNINKPVLLIVNGIHSGEIEGKDAVMLLLREMLISKEKEKLLDSLTLLVVPIFNVDGHERRSNYNRINQNGPEEMGWRTTAQNLNLNRDWLKADAPEMRAMLKLYSDWLPDFMIDTHTTDGADYQYSITYGVEKFSNIYFGTANWLNEKFVPFFESKVEKKGFLIRPYIYLKEWQEGPDGGIIDWAASPRFSTGYAALQNRPSLLIETHMIKPYKERVYSTKAALETVIDFISLNASELKRLNKEADNNSIKELLQEGQFLPVSYEATDKYESVDFKGYEYFRDTSIISGSKKLVYTKKKKNFRIKYFNNVITTDSVFIPAAYLIPKEWEILVDILELHGVYVEELRDDSLFNVTRYRFKKVKFANLPYEGRQRVNFDYDTYQENLTVPAGTFYVPANQRTIRVIGNLLEPKSDDSFVKWGFLNVTFERKEYFENYVMENIAGQMLESDPVLKKEFEAKLADNEKFRNDPRARLNFFYKRSPYFDNHYRVYPVMRIE